MITNCELADILIIDDDITVIMGLNKALSKIGRIRFSLDANQAVVMIQEKIPNIILLDVELPDVGGLELCSKLKANPDTANIPVLFITSHTEDGFEEKVFDTGASDYITKPLNPRVVAARTQTHLAYHRAIRLLDNQARTDSMTGLANRRTFDEQLISEFRRAHRQQECLTVVVIDIDEFKKYNDQYGHLKGDDCIKTIASTLKESLKRPGDLAARYGGEEFAFILPNTNAEGAGQLLHKLLKIVEQLKLIHAQNAIYQYVTISIGYSTISPDQANTSSLDEWAIVKAADNALYESKRNGRNCISYEQIGAVATATE